MSNRDHRYLEIPHGTNVAEMMRMIRRKWPWIKFSEVDVLAFACDKKNTATLQSRISYHIRQATQGLKPLEKRVMTELIKAGSGNIIDKKSLKALIPTASDKSLQKTIDALRYYGLVTYYPEKESIRLTKEYA